MRKTPVMLTPRCLIPIWSRLNIILFRCGCFYHYFRSFLSLDLGLVRLTVIEKPRVTEKPSQGIETTPDLFFYRQEYRTPTTHTPYCTLHATTSFWHIRFRPFCSCCPTAFHDIQMHTDIHNILAFYYLFLNTTTDHYRLAQVMKEFGEHHFGSGSDQVHAIELCGCFVRHGGT